MRGVTSCIIMSIFLCRLYSGPKDTAYFDILSSKAFRKVMKNNVDPGLSFNTWDISIEKTLKKSKSALFADSEFMQWHEFNQMVIYIKILS